jgi:hypothetical protein
MADTPQEVADRLKSVEATLTKIAEQGPGVWKNILQKEYGDELFDFAEWAHNYLVHLATKSALPIVGEAAAAPTGAELIAAERQEQIHKHGWDVKHDEDYGRGELVQAAATCLSLYVTGEMASIISAKCGLGSLSLA